LSASEDDKVALEMVEAGATSYVVKSSHPDELVDAVLRSARGERVLAPVVSSGVIDGLTNRIAASKRADLDRGQLVDRIKDVLHTHAFSPVFQPIVRLDTREVVGYEALTRFSGEPRRGPHEWFADAAAAGMAEELELAAARSALEAFRSAAIDGFLSLNISPPTLARLTELLGSIDGTGIVVELTEHAPIDDYDEVAARLRTLRALGVRVAVDDAGAGFASLRHTLQLTPDLLKLDVSLTQGVDTDERRRALAAGMVGFAAELEATVVAEGIEQEAELETLRALGVAWGQGYLLGRPEPVTR
jgi:EAL domain-containing protein (putative c-di-GMP-specific phosphodiesterase class I)